MENKKGTLYQLQQVNFRTNTLHFQLTICVADTGDFKEISKYNATDATTNPSLLLKLSAEEKYKYLIINAVEFTL